MTFAFCLGTVPFEMDTHQKLELLSDASRFDLSCACGSKNDDHRKRGPDGMWVYPASVPRGGRSIMLKTLMSNACVNDCKYCPFRQGKDTRRCTMGPDELAKVLYDYARQDGIFGLFLSSGVIRNPDHTMERMTAAAHLLRRKYQYRGFLHLKVIPGASDEAIAKAISLASAVSVNVETPHRRAFAKLSQKKDFDRDIVGTIRKISELTATGSKHARVDQSTQFLVGAADETDSQIVKATFGLYKRLGLSRVYYSAYQRGFGDPSLPGENSMALQREKDLFGDCRNASSCDIFLREHRLYQADFLMRKYGFSGDEIPFETNGNLSLTRDPKEAWATMHPELFPVDINRAGKFELLRIPGLGPVSVNRILSLRKNGDRIHRLTDLGKAGKRLKKISAYIKFGY